jgi:hypothetical protein
MRRGEQLTICAIWWWVGRGAPAWPLIHQERAPQQQALGGAMVTVACGPGGGGRTMRGGTQRG